MGYTHRFDLSKAGRRGNWAHAVAEEVLTQHPSAPRYTTAAGISPSGVVHFGNFRDIVTSHLVREALREKGKEARLIFSWDNFDRFRKVPAGIPDSFIEHIGKPLSKIPAPPGSPYNSYAEHFQAPFEEAMNILGMDIIFLNQTTLHESGVYDDAIIHAINHREKIADILLSFMTDKAKGEKGLDPVTFKKNYYPISLYSRFSGKDNTKIISFDGERMITYRCTDTHNEETVDITKDHIVKLGWKPDWAMRWKHEQVHFEPGGHDHASPGGSYDAASVITKEIFGYDAPIFTEYKFVGIQGLGSKMSGSKGNAVSPLELLHIYEPEVLKWLYERKSPDQSFELAFNSEIYRQYDEYDALHADKNAIPFRQAVSFGQIVQWQEEKVQAILDALHLSYTKESIVRRLPLAKNWLVTYNPEEAIEINEKIHEEYAQNLNERERSQVLALREALLRGDRKTIEELDDLVYSIPKENELEDDELKKRQRAFFKTIYNLLIRKDTGPRLGTFLWALDREQVVSLLDI